MDKILHSIQCRMARAAVGWGVRDLAAKAKVSTDTVARLERGEELRERTAEAIRRALEKAGVEFIAENGGGPGVRLKKAKKSKAAKTSKGTAGRSSKTARAREPGNGDLDAALGSTFPASDPVAAENATRSIGRAKAKRRKSN